MMTTRKHVETPRVVRLEEFKENLVDERFPEHRDASRSSHELHSEPGAKVGIGKAQHLYSLPQGPKLREGFL